MSGPGSFRRSLLALVMVAASRFHRTPELREGLAGFAREVRELNAPAQAPAPVFAPASR